MRILAICITALFAAGALHANVVMAPLFTDGAVLQRDKPVPVWGTADAGEQITVSFAGHTVSTTANPAGKWRVDLPALGASSESRTLSVSGENTITLRDVVVGEVWLASGQSNMELMMLNSYDGKFEALAANYPLVRRFKVEKQVAEAPSSACKGAWMPTAPDNVGRFTAVGYFFAVDLHRALGVPVGIINSSWGATRVEAWMDAASAAASKGSVFAAIHSRWAETLADWPQAKAKADAVVKQWEAERDKAAAASQPFKKRRPVDPWGPGHSATPSGLYNGMIHPLVPYALRGAIWYQGESNARRAHEYRELFTAMITGWRAQFAQGDFPFYWVQLANFRDIGIRETDYAFLRGAQTEALALPNTGQAVTIDIGNVTDIHPRNKKDVGRRLALLALARTYGKTTLVDSGPVFEKATIEGSTMRVEFKKSNALLTSPRGEQPAGFELAGADRFFYPATARIDNNTIIVSSQQVPTPVAVRYAWRNSPEAGLFNTEGLPACPLRSDDWEAEFQSAR